ncbi:hypothetical protein [Amycolatopsis sp. NPDC004079]|uniref:hypothetical protein n=1 Tax=Amycolatopsis sp. NPDC004079 TaxID=3154549 RepID=UPI0033B7790D
MGKIETYVNQEFRRLRHLDAACNFCEMSFENCHFDNCVLLQDSDPSYPIEVKDVSVSGGSLTNSSAVGTSFERVSLSSCQTPGDPIAPQGCVFSEVKLRGSMGSWIFTDMHSSIPEETRAEFLEAEREFYKNVDFALDVSEGIFETADMFYLPGDLVVRDPETQVLIRKSRLATADVSRLPRLMVRLLRRVEKNPYDSTAFVVGRDREDFDEALAELQLLVDLGIAER